MSNSLGQDVVIPSPGGSPVNGNSMAGNITSQPILTQRFMMGSFGLSWTGSSPVGVVSVQGSNDFKLGNQNQVINPGTWNTLTLNYGGSAVTTVPVTGSTGSGMIDITMTGIYALRLVYTRTSGTGNLTVIFCGKG